MGILRLLGGLAGVAALLGLLIVVIGATMWLAAMFVRYLPLVGRRHKHERWAEMQREHNERRPVRR